jgi:hypothetical protein
MALKRQITKAEHTALNPAIQIEYKAEGENFVLDATGFDDPAELRRARDREKARADDEKVKADAAQSKLDALGPDAQRKLADLTVLEKSWQDKLAKETGALNTKLAERDGFIEKALVDTVAAQIASELAGENASILLPHIKTRLKVEHVEGASPLTRVLDKDGKPSALSVADLSKEFANDPRYKVVVIASKASGGGAAGGNGNGGGAGASGEKKFGQLNDKERTEFYKRDPKGFEEASKAHQIEQRNAPPVQRQMVAI